MGDESVSRAAISPRRLMFIEAGRDPLEDGMADYEREEHEGGGGFMMGLLTGTVLGAGLGMLLAPKRGSELRNQLSEQASSIGRRASGAVTEMADRARDVMGRGTEQMRVGTRAADDARHRSAEGAARTGTGFGSGVGLGAPDTTAPGAGGSMTPGGTTYPDSTSTSGSTYTGAPGAFERDRS
jgi:gas vesicle protein